MARKNIKGFFAKPMLVGALGDFADGLTGVDVNGQEQSLNTKNRLTILDSSIPMWTKQYVWLWWGSRDITRVYTGRAPARRAPRALSGGAPVTPPGLSRENLPPPHPPPPLAFGCTPGA
jgi:hypothetical protein